MKKIGLLTICFLFSFLNLFAQAEKDSLGGTIDQNHEDGHDKTIYTVVEEMPEFPGGQESLTKFLRKNIRYPKLSRKKGIQGVVYATFFVTEKGEIEDPIIVKGIDEACDEEVLRVLKIMPRWIPGRQSGKDVIVKYSLPFRFRLH